MYCNLFILTQSHNFQKIINNLFLDGQLDECELTLRDLHEIARSFNKLLTGIHHHRIEYSERRSEGNGNENRFDGTDQGGRLEAGGRS